MDFWNKVFRSKYSQNELPLTGFCINTFQLNQLVYIENKDYSQNSSNLIVFSTGCINLVLLAWHLNVELSWCLLTCRTSNLLTITLAPACSTLPSTRFSLTNQDTVGDGWPEEEKNKNNYTFAEIYYGELIAKIENQ